MKESKKINKYLDLSIEPKNVVEHEGDGNTNNSWHTRNSLQEFEEETSRIENQKKNWDHTDHSIVDIG